ncbi:L,D-transpeptidase [Nakamurella panacisegetis]|nr:L,D-transpeptidase [Nakamurella panacisegetis]
MSSLSLSRRTFLAVAALGGLEAVLTACTSSSSPVVVTTTVTPGDPVSSAGVAPSSAAGAAPSSAAASSGAAPASGAVSSGAPAASTPPVTASPTTTAAPTGKPVHVRLYQGDGKTYGVGLPIIVYMSKVITDAKAFVKATTVKVNGTVIQGAWYFQKSAIYSGYPMEAHYRPQTYWPAHAAISLDLPIKNVSAGKGLLFDDSLTLSIKTGAANITMVDGATERLVTTSDGLVKFNFPVSLGKASTPTFNGTKVIMERAKLERMIGTTPGDEYDLEVPWSCRLTNSGEFIHAASWNGGNIGQRSTSNGCTNLNVDAAKQFFDFALIGDVAVYKNTGGGDMPVWDGYGDWNLSWAEWSRGGAVSTS